MTRREPASLAGFVGVLIGAAVSLAALKLGTAGLVIAVLSLLAAVSVLIPARATVSATRDFDLPPTMAFDAVISLPIQPDLHPYVLEVRDEVDLPTGGSSFTLVCRKGAQRWTEDHVAREVTAPHRFVDEGTFHRETGRGKVQFGTSRTEVTCTALGPHARVAIVQRVTSKRGGLLVIVKARAGRATLTRLLERMEARATADRCAAGGERVTGPDIGPYLPPET